LPRIRDIALGTGAVAVAAGAAVLLWMVRSEASRAPGDHGGEGPALAVPSAARERGGARDVEAARKARERPEAEDEPEEPPPPVLPPDDRAAALRRKEAKQSLVPPPPRPTLDSPALPGLIPSVAPSLGGSDADREAKLEQRKLASLERRALAIVRRLGADQGGGTGRPEEQVERDRERLERLKAEINERRSELGMELIQDFSNTE
jgi:hypothetical protein